MWRNVHVCRPRRSTSGGQSSGSEGVVSATAAAAVPVEVAAAVAGLFLVVPPVHCLKPVQT